MNAQVVPRDLKAGTELANRYTLIRPLGRGGIAAAWLAADRMTGANVALKILPNADANRGALHSEWQTSIRLMHPHIVRVFEFHDDAAGAFFSMQPIDGPDAGVLAGASPDAVLPVIAAVADALRYAHGKGVVHRDVKAANVLLDGNGAPYLIDFGVAANQGANATGGSLIAASPAVLRGEQAGTADDVFALGGLAYELLAGRSPYSSSDTAADIEHKVPPPVRSASGEDLPAEIVDLIAAMLAKEAKDRPDAETIVDTLAAAGVRPGAVPVALLGSRRGTDAEIIEARETGVGRRRKAADPTPASVTPGGGDGLSPRTVLAALAVLVLLLVGVVFLLPSTVDLPTESSAGTATTTGDDSTEAEQTDAEEKPDSDADAATLPDRDERVEARQETEAVLGQLLAAKETLEGRAVQRWAGARFEQAVAAYEAGDEAYLARDYATATTRYKEAIELFEPLLDEVDGVFDSTLEEAEAALADADAALALERFDLAVAISPGSARAQDGYERARNLDEVLALVEAGLAYEDNLELDAASESFRRAMELDDEWQPARDGYERVQGTRQQMDFDSRMSEGLAALAEGDFESARAAFRMAQRMRPNSSEPTDGLMQVDQGLRLARINSLESRVAKLEQEERWEDAVEAYEEILELDENLAFAQDGLANARSMVALHTQLDEFIAAPDALSSSATMQRATNLVVSITRMDSIGPRLTGQRDELSRLLKRAATPLTVQFVSDNATNVSIYKVGRLGTFETQALELRPGSYVAVGSRPGYRDVRLEFQVGPEIDMRPIVVQCEEPI
jgi:tetratricopeptide (TPR) repeat protein